MKYEAHTYNNNEKIGLLQIIDEFSACPIMLFEKLADWPESPDEDSPIMQTLINLEHAASLNPHNLASSDGVGLGFMTRRVFNAQVREHMSQLLYDEEDIEGVVFLSFNDAGVFRIISF